MAIGTNVNFIVIVRIFLSWEKITLTLLAVLNNAGCFRAAINYVITFLAKRLKSAKYFQVLPKSARFLSGRVKKLGSQINFKNKLK